MRKLASRIDLALASNTGYCATAHTRDYYSIHMRFEKRCYFDVRSKSYMSQEPTAKNLRTGRLKSKNGYDPVNSLEQI